jgi:purine nucleosidase
MKIRVSLLIWVVWWIAVTGCNAVKQDDRIPVIIDADTANEVDDLFALVRAILAPELDLKGITSAQFHISPLATDTTVLESQAINEDLRRLMDQADLPLPIGSNQPLTSAELPQTSPASDFIVAQAHLHSAEHPLNLVILGSCTNVASAILQDPTIIPKVKVHYLGFWYDPLTNVYNKKEFNSGNDTLAVAVLLNTPQLDLTVMSATTSQHLVFEKAEVDQQLKDKGPMAYYLIERWESYDRWWTEEDPEKLRWIMWDVAIIEALIHPERATKESFSTPPENLSRQIQIYTKIDTKGMEADFWKSLEDL